MPRIPPSIIRQARLLDPFLSRLLPVCRDLPSAQNELRWLAQHARAGAASGTRNHDQILRHYVSRRARGEPLQYILGSEYFGDLEIKCRPGVLIPRQETAASVTYLAERVNDLRIKHIKQGSIRVLDLCTGTGCIPLLFHHEFYAEPENEQAELDLIAIDISPIALQLASDNREAHLRALKVKAGCQKHKSLANLSILQGDVLAHTNAVRQGGVPSVAAAIQQEFRGVEVPKIDILISNPPYISSKAYHRTTTPSVRHFEPKSALVPPVSSTTDGIGKEAWDGDAFYPRLLSLAEQLCAQVLMFEVADQEQAERVVELVVESGVWDAIEVWKDWPTARFEHQHEVAIGGRGVPVLGEGHGRSVFAYRKTPERR